MKKTVYVFANSNSFIIQCAHLFPPSYALELFHLRYPLEEMSDAAFSLQQIDEMKVYQLYQKGLLATPFRLYYDHYTIERIKSFLEKTAASVLLFEFSSFSDTEKSIVKYLKKEYPHPIIGILPKSLLSEDTLSACLDLGIHKVHTGPLQKDLLDWMTVPVS